MYWEGCTYLWRCKSNSILSRQRWGWMCSSGNGEELGTCLNKESPSPPLWNEMCMVSGSAREEFVLTTLSLNTSFHFREFFSYKFTLSMFLNKKEVHHLLPSLELKAKKKKKKRILQLLYLGLISLNVITSAQSLICQTECLDLWIRYQIKVGSK